MSSKKSGFASRSTSVVLVILVAVLVLLVIALVLILLIVLILLVLVVLIRHNKSSYETFCGFHRSHILHKKSANIQAFFIFTPRQKTRKPPLRTQAKPCSPPKAPLPQHSAFSST